MSEINAAIATIQIKKLPKFLKLRKKNAELLSNLLQDLDINLPQERKHEQVNWYLFTIATEKRNKLMKKLNEQGIGAVSYYSKPIHKNSFFKQKINLPITDKAASQVLSLPIHPKVTRKNIEFIAKILHDTL